MQLVSILDLPPEEAHVSDSPAPAAIDTIDIVVHFDFTEEDVSYARSGDTIVSYPSRPWFPSSYESPAHTFQVVSAPSTRYIIFTEVHPEDNSISSIQSTTALIIDSGFTINTAGSSSAMSSYATPSLSGIAMRSAMGEIGKPAGEGCIPLVTVTGSPSLVLNCQHTPEIPSSIMFPALTCESLGYDSYQLTCHHHKGASSDLFCKTGAPYITLHGTYVHHVQFIALPSAAVQSLFPAVASILSPTISARLTELLSLDPDESVHHILHVISLGHHHHYPSPEDFCLGIFHLFHERLANDWNIGGIPLARVLHVSDMVVRTLWFGPVLQGVQGPTEDEISSVNRKMFRLSDSKDAPGHSWP
jgi:hypothetical protein